MEIKENRSSRKKREKIESKTLNKKSKDVLKGKSKYEKQIMMLINSEIEVISFLFKVETDKQKMDILQKGIDYQKQKEYPIIFHNLVSLLNAPVKSDTVDNTKPKMSITKNKKVKKK